MDIDMSVMAESYYSIFILGVSAAHVGLYIGLLNSGVVKHRVINVKVATEYLFVQRRTPMVSCVVRIGLIRDIM